MPKRKPADTETSQDASAQMALEQRPPDEEIPAEKLLAAMAVVEADEAGDDDWTEDLSMILDDPEDDEADDDLTAADEEALAIAEYDHETVTLLREAEREVAEAEEEWERAQKHAKAKKSEWEGKVEDLRKLIRERTGPETMPLFDKPKAEAPAGDTWRPEDVVALSDQAKATAAAEDAWRRESIVLLCDHGVSETVYTKLVEAGIKTLGDLADWTNAGKRLVDIKGVGESKAERIVSALDAIWKAWQEDRDAAMQAAREAVAEENGEEVPDPDEDTRPADNWREIPLASLGLEPLIVDLLQAEEITTVGRAANFLGLGGDFADIPGLGGDFAETIKSALARFRVERGGTVLEGFPAELLAPAPAEEPAPTKAVRKSRASA